MFSRRRILCPNPLGPSLMAQLLQANQLQAQGQMLEAARLFAQLASVMKARQHPRRAASLYARAAHAFTDGNDASSALLYSRQALTLFTQVQMPSRALAFYANITRKMRNHGMQAQAEALQSEFGGKFPAVTAPSAAGSHHKHPLLPTNCPKCGATVHTEDATWVDDHAIECEYCGALIRSE
jgi:hypothetical protein